MSSSDLDLRHEIFILDGELEKDVSMDIVPNFIEKLISVLEMQKLDDLVLCEATDVRAPGWSFVQPITTSHISGHYFSGEHPQIHIDIYSCKGIDYKKIVAVTNEFFALKKWLGSFIHRDLDPMKRAAIEMIGKKGKVINTYALHAQNMHSFIEEAKIKVLEKHALSI